MIGTVGRTWRAGAPDVRRLVRSDVEELWQGQRPQVVAAFRNFTALRFIRLPVDSAAERVIEKPLRDVVNDVCDRMALPVAQRRVVYTGVLLALGGLPLGMGLSSPFGLIDDLDGLVAGRPADAAAVQEIWEIVDDADFWISIGRRFRYSPAV